MIITMATFQMRMPFKHAAVLAVAACTSLILFGCEQEQIMSPDEIESKLDEIATGEQQVMSLAANQF